MSTSRRVDVGVAPFDGGFSGPLPLTVGMSFTYQGILTARTDLQNEAESAYELTLTISAINEMARTVEFGATGTNRVANSWNELLDFSMWVGRVGPSVPGDLVGEGTAVTGLDTAATAPPTRNPKALPAGGPFFIDVRDIDQIRAQFAEAYAGAQPTVASPEDSGNNRWRFSFNRVGDTSIITYNEQRRQTVLEYDPRGFLVRLTEDLGDSENPPFGNARLTLQSGP